MPLGPIPLERNPLGRIALVYGTSARFSQNISKLETSTKISEYVFVMFCFKNLRYYKEPNLRYYKVRNDDVIKMAAIIQSFKQVNL